MVLPPLIIAIVFAIIPTATVLLLSFNPGEVMTFDPSRITLENYIKIFARPVTYVLLRDTFSMSILATVITFIVAYPVSYFLAFKVKSSFPRVDQ